MKKLRTLVAFTTALISSNMKAQMPRMEIIDQPKEKSVTIQSVNVQVEIFGNLAKTTITLVFYNKSNRNLEGNLLFPLSENTSVSSYAIDINGKLRQAVPVEKARAVEVFESIQKHNVDPGILEKVEGNNFRTRISPIPANGARTVQIAYFQQLQLEKSAYQYHLPLDYSDNIGKFNITVKVFNAVQRPQLAEAPDGSFNFSENSNVYEASLIKTDFKPTKSLTIHLPKVENKIESFIQKNTDGSAYFYTNAILDMKPIQKVWAKNLGIIWDNSLSGLKRDHKKELELLGKIIAQQQNLHIEVGLLNICFEKGSAFDIKNGDWSALKNYLGNIVYDGGTDYSELSSHLLKADEYLFFSDGISSFGSSQFTFSKPICTIATAATSNFGTLKYIAQKNNGKFINLTESSVDKAFEQINTQGLQFLGIKNNQGFSETYPMVGTEAHKDFSLSGIAQNTSGKITLQFGRNGKVELEKEVDLQNASQVFDISKVWAQQKIAYLELNAEQNKADIAEIGKEFRIVTSNTSLIVLENVSDYVKYKINPPAELRSEYDNLMKQNFARSEERNTDLLRMAIARAKELKAWWEKDFKPVKSKYPKPKVSSDSNDLEEAVVLATASTQRMTDAVQSEATFDQRGIAGNVRGRAAAAHTNIQGSAASKIAPDAPGKKVADNTPTPEIKTANIKSDKDYIKAIEASKNPYQTYLDLRAAYEGTPSYYFDVAAFFFQQKDSTRGLLILSSITDLGLEDAELYKMVAYKLKEVAAYPQELFITKKVLDWRPFDAQSYRDYGLALKDNGRYQDALDNLYKVLTKDYTTEISSRDRDITETIVPEINNLVALHRSELKLSNINKDILVDIPVDIRVVLNWNKDMTDIDLWVTDPNGEKCYYSHKTTAIGGRISDDITQGFGPEQFLLKKAIKGKYKIETNFFAERQMSISGATTISTEIYLFYSSGKQVRKTITFQNDKANLGKDGILVGAFEF
ncbi:MULTISPECIES: VIT domain-containing protein [Chitinophagaceae]